MTRVAFVTMDWGRDAVNRAPCIPGGSGWARCHLPAMGLEEMGHEVVVGMAVGGRSNGMIIPLNLNDRPIMVEPEVVVLHRWMHEEAPEGIKRAKAAGQVVVVDVDDWFWGLDPRNRARWGTSKRRDPTHNRDWYAQTLPLADVVTVSSEFLAKRLRERMGANTRVLRNMVAVPAFEQQTVRDVRDGLVVGWVGAIGWRSGDLEVMRDALDPFLAETSSTFVHHGVFPGDLTTAAYLAGVDESRVGPSEWFRQPWDYPELVRGFDIGVVPLSQQPFNFAKSWIKGLEYAAAGIPFVATRTREYEELGAGLLVSTPAEWNAALWRLRDPAERERVRERGLEAARRNDVRARAPEWERLYQDLLTSVHS